MIVACSMASFGSCVHVQVHHGAICQQGAWANIPCSVGPEEPDLLELVARFRWLCAELQAGNAFSYATLEGWRSKADVGARRAEPEGPKDRMHACVLQEL